jgi:hypothetical protein
MFAGGGTRKTVTDGGPADEGAVSTIVEPDSMSGDTGLVVSDSDCVLARRAAANTCDKTAAFSFTANLASLQWAASHLPTAPVGVSESTRSGQVIVSMAIVLSYTEIRELEQTPGVYQMTRLVCRALCLLSVAVSCMTLGGCCCLHGLVPADVSIAIIMVAAPASVVFFALQWVAADVS